MTSDGTSQNEGVNVMGALIGVHCLEVGEVANHVVLVNDSVSTKHVASISSDGQSLAAIVPFHDRDHLRGE